MDVGLIIVGDELLSGKRQDKHLGSVIGMLRQRGLELSWAWMLGDDPALLERQFRASFALPHPVLVTGGIGATPDDCTRQAAARAAGLGLEVQPEAAATIIARWGEQAYPNRIRMAEFPIGARPIPNPVNQVAGFSLHDHHFVPGFPDMAWPMLAWVLDTYYADRHRTSVRVERLIRVTGVPESELIAPMEAVLARHAVKISSLPSGEESGLVELGVSGEAATVEAASRQLLQELQQRLMQYADLGLRSQRPDG